MLRNIYHYKNQIVLTNGAVIYNYSTKKKKRRELYMDNYTQTYLSTLNNKKIKKILKDNKSINFYKKLNI